MKSQKKLSKRQQEVLDAIYYYKGQHSYSPSVRELGEILGLSSPATVHEHLSTLRKKGYITWKEKNYRTIEIVKEG